MSEAVLDSGARGRTPLLVIEDGAEDRVGRGASESSWILSLDLVRDRRTIEGKAQELVRVVRERFPRGPYRIQARALAGLVAYEMAVELCGVDQVVEWLGLEETPCWTWNERAARRGTATEPLLLAALDYEPSMAPVQLTIFQRRESSAALPDLGWRRILEDRVTFRVVGDNEPSEARDVAGGAEPSTLSHAARVERDRTYSPAVRIQTGGAGAPFFCVPGAGASATDFVFLAAGLGTDRSVHAFQPRGMDGEATPYATVEAAAEANLRDLRRLYPHGPVNLVGHSFGGWIAFEMALRLQQQGRRVISLGLLDCDHPDGERGIGLEYTRAEALLRLVTLYEQAALKPLHVTARDLDTDAESQLVLLHRRLVEVGILPRRSTPAVLRGSCRCFASALRTRYRPQGTFDGPVTLAFAAGREEPNDVAAARFERTARGWARFVTRAAVHAAAGNHVTMLRLPHATALGAFLGEAQERSFSTRTAADGTELRAPSDASARA